MVYTRGAIEIKEIINNPNAVVEEMLQDIEITNPDVLCDREGVVITREEKGDKVGLVSGGGSGYEPVHTGYVDYGMLDTVANGNIFAPSSPDRVLCGIQPADSGHGVLLIVKSYAGSIMNFEIAEELADVEGIEVDHVVVRDDTAATKSDESTDRRGIVETIFVYRLAGMKARTGASLAEIKCAAEKAVGNVGNSGVSLLACTIPVVGTHGFTIEEDCMEVGMSIHGKAGIGKTKPKLPKEIVNIMVNRILADKDYGHSEVTVIVNSLGATPLMGLYILASDVYTQLCVEGLKPVKYYVGNCMTAIEMARTSYSILQLDEELKRLLEYLGSTPTFREIG